MRIKDRMVQLQQKLKMSQDRLLQLSSLEQESYGHMSAVAKTSQDLTISNTTPTASYSLDSNHYGGIDFEAICNALDKQRIGLSVLTDVLSKNIRDIHIMKRELNLD